MIEIVYILGTFTIHLKKNQEIDLYNLTKDLKTIFNTVLENETKMHKTIVRTDTATFNIFSTGKIIINTTFLNNSKTNESLKQIVKCIKKNIQQL